MQPRRADVHIAIADKFLANDFKLLHQLDKDPGAGPKIILMIIIILVQGIGCSGEESAIGLISEETSKRFRF